MKPKLNIVTLGVSNLRNARDFYERKFGWTPVAVNKDIVFYKLNGILLSLFGKQEPASEAGVSTVGGSIGLDHLVDTAEEVDELSTLLEGRGVDIVKRPEMTFFGAYVGYVADNEGNVWGVGCNPYIELDEQGNVVTHKDIKHLER